MSLSELHADKCQNCGRTQMPRRMGQNITARKCQACGHVEELKEPTKLEPPQATLNEPKPTLLAADGYAPGLRYRATLVDRDTARERPLTIYGNSLRQIEDWAVLVLKTALDGAVVNVYQSVEQLVKMIPKPTAEATKP